SPRISTAGLALAVVLALLVRVWDFAIGGAREALRRTLDTPAPSRQVPQMPADLDIQRISRLTPLSDVVNSFQTSIGAVEAREEPLADALGKTLAADVAMAQPIPGAALALRDGYALSADLTLDASAYAPARLSPAPVRVEVGQPL